MSELEDAIRLANKVLDDHTRDPDDDLSMLSRQFLRSLEGTTQPTPTTTEGLRCLEELANMPLGISLEEWCRLSGPILAALSTAPAGDGDADTLAAKDPALSEMRAELERVKIHLSAWEDSARINKARADEAEAQLERARKALEPFAEQSRLFDEAAIHFSASPPPDSHPVAMRITRGLLRAAARALASQDEGEDR